MVETGGLENRCAGNRTGGSNPSPSAICPKPGWAQKGAIRREKRTLSDCLLPSRRTTAHIEAVQLERVIADLPHGSTTTLPTIPKVSWKTQW